MATVTERQRARRARLDADGYKDVTVTVRLDQTDRIKTLATACNDGRPLSLRLIPALNALRAAAAELREHGVARAGVFGSAARGEDGPASDVDVVLVLEAGVVLDLIALTRLKLRVADIVSHALDGCEVDVAIQGQMHPTVRASADREAVYAY
jgi:hypothetical protein